MGLNTYHYLGGPCGEIAALSNHAADAPGDPIVAVAAADGPSGSVIAPCGKCRQILYDIDPQIRCIIRDPNGLRDRTVDELLPHAYDWRAVEQPQRMYLWEGYEPLIRKGSKRQTIRVDDPFRVGPATLVFEKQSGEVATIDADVTEVRTVRRDQLTREDAVHDGFDDLEALHRALDRHYPGLTGADVVDVVSFSVRPATGR
ncbi:ASCH domain-containing protein [Mycolicibacterium thermoresistibile]